MSSFKTLKAALIETMINTRFFKFIQQLEVLYQKKMQFFQKNFAFSIFILGFGFVCGNLFGTFLTFFRRFTSWDGTIIASTIVFIECINYLNYTQNSKNKSVIQTSFIFLNFYKIGLLLGFFTDAFKVGS